MKRITVRSTLFTLALICLLIIILSGKRCDECFSLPAMMAKFFACGIVILIGSFYSTRLYLKNEAAIFNIELLPLLNTDEAVADVPFSCEGFVYAEKEKILESPFTKTPCVYYHAILEKQVGSGKNRRWVVVQNLINLSPFFVRDGRGTLKIDPANLDNDYSGFSLEVSDRTIPDPDNSEIDCTRMLVNEPLEMPGTFLGLPFISDRYRRSEYVLQPGTGVFACGFLSKRNGELVLHEHPSYPLIVSRKSKETYISEFYEGRNLVFLVHFLMAFGFSVALLSANHFLNVPQARLLTVLVTGNVLLLGSIAFTAHNRLTTLSQRAQFALCDIDIELKRRAELIPRITDVVKAHAGYERQTQALMAQIRAHTVFLESQPDHPKREVSPLVAIMESFPEISSAENFRKLMLELVDTEERIAYARAFYNRNVGKLNTLVRQFPFMFVAGLTGVGTMRFVSIGSNDAKPPVVD